MKIPRKGTMRARVLAFLRRSRLEHTVGDIAVSMRPIPKTEAARIQRRTKVRHALRGLREQDLVYVTVGHDGDEPVFWGARN